MPVNDARNRLARRFFFAGLFLTTALFLYLIRLFLLPILLAAVFATLFFPLYLWLQKILLGRRGLAAAACCFLLVLLLVLPIYGVAAMAAGEILDLYDAGAAS